MAKKMLKNIFVSSIYQNAGKTTVSIGLYKALKERNIRTGFIKPVGQKYVSVGDLKIDKDSYLMAEVFKTGRQFSAMSPVTIGRGYTEKYIFEPQKARIQSRIEKAFNIITKKKDAVIVEGTGHAGVGSVIDFSNADVAKLLGSKVIIISEGGIGKSIDEIVLNRSLFETKNVEILGVIINKVLPEKYQRIKRALKKGLSNKGIRLLGVIPMQPLLSMPTMEQVKEVLKLDLLCGRENLHKRVKHTVVAAMEPHNMIQHLKDGTLVLASGDRVDNILAAVSSHLVNAHDDFPVSGIILTGGLMPSKKIIELLERSKMPVLITEADTYTIAGLIEHLICKIQKTDIDKINEASRLVQKYVNIDMILKHA
ncbi:MAG: AAA family ATPase [Candidatus Omnitrophica bacterium]|nr:AAA family ATPase [Candidatus Omnitrophota bacterium]